MSPHTGRIRRARKGEVGVSEIAKAWRSLFRIMVGLWSRVAMHEPDHLCAIGFTMDPNCESS